MKQALWYNFTADCIHVDWKGKLSNSEGRLHYIYPFAGFSTPFLKENRLENCPNQKVGYITFRHVPRAEGGVACTYVIKLCFSHR